MLKRWKLRLILTLIWFRHLKTQAPFIFKIEFFDNAIEIHRFISLQVFFTIQKNIIFARK